VVDQNKWNITGWGAAQGRIREAVHFLCEGRSRTEREEIAHEVVGVVMAIARGDRPAIQSDPLLQRDEHEREVWARHVAQNVVSVAMVATERMPTADRDAVLREIAKLALWHMPNAPDEARQLVRTMQIDVLKQSPHPRDDPPGRD
jgi:hypothetical protein